LRTQFANLPICAICARAICDQFATNLRPAKQVDHWGIIAGDKTWRKSAFALQELLSQQH